MSWICKHAITFTELFLQRNLSKSDQCRQLFHEKVAPYTGNWPPILQATTGQQFSIDEFKPAQELAGHYHVSPAAGKKASA